MQPDSTILALDQLLRRSAPIDGVSVGRWEDKRSWRIAFRPEATAEQRAAAYAALEAFDVEAERAKPKPKTPEEIFEERLARMEARLTAVELRVRSWER